MEIVDIGHAYPKAVVCLASALSFYKRTTFNPQEISIALPHNYRAPREETRYRQTYRLRPAISNENGDDALPVGAAGFRRSYHGAE